MEMEKVEMKSQEWILRIGNVIIPITALKAGVEIILLFVVGMFAYNVGQNDAVEQVKLNAYISDTGIYNSLTNSFYKCYMFSEGIKIIWRCENTNYTYAGNLRVPKSFVNNSLSVLNNYSS